eukprot:16451715-Heterocapsa_arctica.AAC.2
MWYRALRFIHSRSEIHVEEPIGEWAPCRDPMDGTHSRSQSSSPSDSPGPEVLMRGQRDDTP